MTTTAAEPPKSAAAPAAVKPQTDPQAGCRADDIVIGPGVRTAGRFQTAGSVFVDGVLEGADVACQWLSISRGGEFHGAVKAARVEISGSLDGEAIATDEIVLRSTAVVTGKITAPYIIVHRGAYVCGTVDSLERQEHTPGKPTVPLPLPKARARRTLHLLVAASVTGLLLATGASLAWWRDQDPDARTASPPAEALSGDHASVASQ